jgi:rhodanese-related sulfurtransferase
MQPLEISVHDVASLRKAGEEFLLLDCRELDEHAIVAIGGSMLLPMGELSDRVSELAGREAERIVVYCHLGGRSLRVAHWLRQQGFQHAQSMTGGIDEWAVEIEPGMARY